MESGGCAGTEAEFSGGSSEVAHRSMVSSRAFCVGILPGSFVHNGGDVDLDGDEGEQDSGGGG